MTTAPGLTAPGEIAVTRRRAAGHVAQHLWFRLLRRQRESGQANEQRSRGAADNRVSVGVHCCAPLFADEAALGRW